jgi:uncharacterized membrane protein YraQ (UPF0718 family)
MKKANIIALMVPLVVAAIALLIWMIATNAQQGITPGLIAGWRMLIGMMPMLTVMFVMTGLALMVAKQHESAVHGFLSGKGGYPGSLVVSALFPGSLTGLPMVKTLWESGAPKGPLLTFLLATPMIGWQMCLFKQPMIGWKIMSVQLVAGCFYSVFIATTCWGYEKFVGFK